MNIFLKFKFYLQRKLNGEVPSRSEVLWAYKRYRHARTVTIVMRYYAYEGDDIETIAGFMGFPRERVRQLLMKGVREARRDD